MKYNHDKQELIDRYVQGEMDKNECVAFEQQLAVDAELRKETELTRTIVSAIRKKGEQDALVAMKSIPKETVRKWITSPKPAKLKNSRMLYLRIATVAAAIAFLFLYIGSRPRYSAVQLFSQYYQVQPYETWPTRGGFDLTHDEREWIRQAESYYRQADFTGALTFYDKLFAQKRERNTLPDEVLFYSAICRFETADLPGAIETLELIISDETSEFHDEAIWNLAFAYLKQGKRNKAKNCFELLVTSGSDYAVKASVIKEKMNIRKFSRF